MKMVDIKLASNNKVKQLPREKSSVKAALLRAMDDSQKDSWNKVFVVGMNKEGKIGTRHTSNGDIVLLGLLSAAEAIIHKDI